MKLSKGVKIAAGVLAGFIIIMLVAGPPEETPGDSDKQTKAAATAPATKDAATQHEKTKTIHVAHSGKPADHPNNKKALEEIRKEPKVQEAIITDAHILYASVEDDGTSRNGYAQYLCSVLQEYQATVKMVKVVKAGSINDPEADNAFGVLLGEAQCQ